MLPLLPPAFKKNARFLILKDITMQKDLRTPSGPGRDVEKLVPASRFWTIGLPQFVTQDTRRLREKIKTDFHLSSAS